ncbi:hypothetical protein MMMB2_2214 [Mycobacterium marinum MB2]|nr:hypothetical protein MMMB2_2214 [Mycobacterium marinum MB2]
MESSGAHTGRAYCELVFRLLAGQDGLQAVEILWCWTHRQIDKPAPPGGMFEASRLP